MDLQTYLDNAVGAMRKERLAKSDQLTLGEMILKMEAICEKKKEDEPEVIFDFGYMFPVDLISWRGSYEELALTYSEDSAKDHQIKASQFLTLLRSAIGKTFEGYKGGDFTMSKHTPVWVSNYGDCPNTAVIEIVDYEYKVIIMTGYREF